jgi:hypothetical protein
MLVKWVQDLNWCRDVSWGVEESVTAGGWCEVSVNCATYFCGLSIVIITVHLGVSPLPSMKTSFGTLSAGYQGFFSLPFSMAVQPCEPGPVFFSSLILYTVGRTPWAGDQPVARPLPTQTQNERPHTHPCLEWDSKPRPQCLGGRRRFIP